MKKSLLKIGALTAAGSLILTGCAGGGEPAEPVTAITNPVAGEAPAGILDGHTLTYAGDGGTTQEGQMAAIFTPFAEATGVTFNQDSPQTLAKVTTQVESGNIQWDFISSFGDAIARECGTLFEELDMSKLDTSNVPEGQLGGTPCGVPSIVYGMVVAWDAEGLGATVPKNWVDFYDTKKIPGKRALYSGDGKIDGSIVQGAAIAAGWNPEAEPFSEEWANKGLDKIESIKDDVIFYNTGAQAQQMLETGEVKLGAVWTGRALAAAENGKNIDVSWENWISLVDYFAIVKGTPNKEAAYYAINYSLGAAQQAKWTEESAYSPTNVQADPQVDDLTRKYLTTVDGRSDSSVPVDLEFWKQDGVVNVLQDRWAGLVAGA